MATVPGSSHYQSFIEVEKDTLGRRFGNEAELRQAFIEALKEEFARACSKEEIAREVLKIYIDRVLRKRRPDIRISNLVIELEPPGKDIEPGRKQLYQYMRDAINELKANRIYGVVSNGVDAELYILERGAEEPREEAIGKLTQVMPLTLQRVCVEKLPILSSEELVSVFNTESPLAQSIITYLYQALKWYKENKGSPSSAHILQLFELWRSLHGVFINISDDGWKVIVQLAEKIGVPGIRGEEYRWLFLFALETYLNLIMRSITLSKIGQAPRTIMEFKSAIERMRGIFEPNVFEWTFEAVEDRSIDRNIRDGLRSSITTLVKLVYMLDFTRVTTDMFRDLYQGIVPKEIRRSLGEFYTSDEIVNQVLDAGGLNEEAIRQLYERWKKEEKDTIILDPACGSGSFLVNAVKRVFRAFGDRPPRDIARFVEENIVGIDINPFAVEMAKLNIIIAIAYEMNTRGLVYTPATIRVYWADSLAKTRIKQGLQHHLAVIELPALRGIMGVKESGEKESCPQGAICIPICPSIRGGKTSKQISLYEVLDKATEIAVRGGEAEEFTNYGAKLFTETCGIEPNPVIKQLFERLYKTVKAIQESGNSRIIELVKNIVALQDLVGKCSFVVGNPPWVRIHGIGKHIANYLRQNYEWVKKGSAYTPKFKKTPSPFPEQFDYSVVFIEKGLEFLRDGGTLSYVITSKITKSMYAGKMREELIEKYTILELIDYSLYPVALFQDATNYPLIISIKNSPPDSKKNKVKVTIYNTAGEARSFQVEQWMLPLYSGTNYPDKARSPWVLAPPEVVSVLKKIISNNPRLGDVYAVTRGVETDINRAYIGTLLGCTPAGIANLSLEGELVTEVEEFLIHPVVRGENIDPYGFSFDSYIIFPHNPATFEPMWDVDQKIVLEAFGLLREDVEVEASGGILKYSVRAVGSYGDVVKRAVDHVRRNGYVVKEVAPCAVYKCLVVEKPSGEFVLGVNIEVKAEGNGYTLVYNVPDLRIPNAPRATQHFTRFFERLVERENYKASLPPWAILAVVRGKFEKYRIAWQEMAKYIEAAYLPVLVDVEICRGRKQKLLIPLQTVYFIIEKDALKALKLLIYMNSCVARSLVKLWAWSGRGGYYRHTSYGIGLLPIPRALSERSLWSHIDRLAKDSINTGNADLNTLAKSIPFTEEMERELAQAFGITWEEYKAIVEYGKWLNEATPLQYSVEELREPEEEE